MNRLDLYLARHVMVGICAALFVICAVDWLGDSFYEIGRISDNDRVSHVVIRTILDLPHKFLEFLPSGLLIGVLLSLGQLAASAEIMAVGSCGYSRLRVGMVACLVGLLFIIASNIFVELYAPIGERLASKYQKAEFDENVMLASDESYWVRDKTKFVQIGSAVSPEYLREITIYQFSSENQIAWIGESTDAILIDEQWVLGDFKRSHFTNNQVSVDAEEIFVWDELLSTNLLASLSGDPARLPMRRLSEYISYLDENQLDAAEYKIIFFKRMAAPFTGLAMLLLALPLVFQPRQAGGIGQRLFFGIVIALVVHVLVEAAANGALVYQFSPIIAAFLPAIILLILAFLVFKFIR
jgi:lipopolysaccharide export system permease protein